VICSFQASRLIFHIYLPPDERVIDESGAELSRQLLRVVYSVTYSFNWYVIYE
jgi:hypothetical protein